MEVIETEDLKELLRRVATEEFGPRNGAAVEGGDPALITEAVKGIYKKL